MIRYYIVFDGNVQGVGFRYFCQMNATNLNLTGWVHNMSNGMVDMQIQGDKLIIEKFLSIIKKGNYFIKVTSVSIKTIDIIPDEKKFRVN